MKKLSTNKKGYIAAMGAIMALILVTSIMFFMITINKKQQDTIVNLKNNFISKKMNNKIALERISGLFHKDLLFDLKENDFIEDSILSFEDIDKRFKIVDVSSNFGIEPREVIIETLEPEIILSLNNNTELIIESSLTPYYENLIGDRLDQGDGSYSLQVQYNNRFISPKESKQYFISNDESYHKIIFKEDEIQAGEYKITRGEPGVYSDYNVYSGKERVNINIRYTLTNRLVKIIELENDNSFGRVYYLKLEDNSSPNNDNIMEDSILVYLLDEDDLNTIMTNNR